jgi:hypothetical protein
VVIMDQDVAAALATLEARLTRIEVRGREVERTVGIRFADEDFYLEPAVPVQEPAADDLVLAEGVDTAEGGEGVDAMVALSPEEIDAALADLVAREGEVPFSDPPAVVVVDEAGPVDWERLAAEGGQPAADTLAGGEG